MKGGGTLESNGENGIDIDVGGFFGIVENGRASERALERLRVSWYERFYDL